MTKTTSLTVRDLSPFTKACLQRRAKAKARSLQAEVRAILDAAAEVNAGMQSDFPKWFLDMIEPGDEDVADFLDSRRRDLR